MPVTTLHTLNSFCTCLVLVQKLCLFQYYSCSYSIFSMFWIGCVVGYTHTDTCVCNFEVCGENGFCIVEIILNRELT